MLSNVSSFVSSSVTPPNKIPIFFACHKDMVQPERIDGAYAVEGRFRFSHFSIGMFCADAFVSVSVGMLILKGAILICQTIRAEREHTSETKYLPA